MSSSTVVTDQEYNQFNRDTKFNPWTMSSTPSSSFSSESSGIQVNSNINCRSVHPVSLAEGTNNDMINMMVKKIFDEDASNNNSGLGAVGDKRPATSMFFPMKPSSSLWGPPAPNIPSVNLMDNNSAFDADVITCAVDSLNFGVNSNASSFFPSSVTHSNAYFPQNYSFSVNPGAGRPITAAQHVFNKTSSVGEWNEPHSLFNSYAMEGKGFPLQGIVNRRPVSSFHEPRSILPRAVGAKNSHEGGLRRPHTINALDSFNGQRPPMSNGMERNLCYNNNHFRYGQRGNHHNSHPMIQYQYGRRMCPQKQYYDGYANGIVVRGQVLPPHLSIAFDPLIKNCFEQHALMDRERKRVEVDLSQLFPNLNISGNNRIFVPRLNSGRYDPIDRVYGELMRDQTRINALMQTMALLTPDINSSAWEAMTNWWKSLQNLEKIRKYDNIMPSGETNMSQSLNSLSLALKELCTRTRAARTAFWCCYVAVVYQEWEKKRTPRPTQEEKKEHLPSLWTPRGEPVIHVSLFEPKQSLP
jgi:hypothetical protein